MRSTFFSAVPSWLVLVLSLSILALAAFYLVGRARPEGAPADYDELRRRYEPVVRLTTTFLIVGIVLGLVLGIQLDHRQHGLHFGIGAGTGALAALCYLSLALGSSSERSWGQYLHYQGMYRRQYVLPPVADVLLLLLLVAWGIYGVVAVLLGT
jgi:hypothetical protein